MEPCLSSSRMAFAEEPHLQYGDVAAAWFTFPAGMVIQWLQPTRATLDHANYLVGPVYGQLEARFPTHNKLTVVFDFELMTGRTSAARSILLGKAKQCAGRFARGYVVLPRYASAAHLQGVRAGIAIGRALGVNLEVADSAARAIAQANLHVAR